MDKRIYLNVLWEPVKTFRVRFGWEKGDIFSSKPKVMPPGDLISLWFDLNNNATVTSTNPDFVVDPSGPYIVTDPLMAGFFRSSTTTLRGISHPTGRLTQFPGGTTGPTVMWMDPNSSEPLNTSYRTLQLHQDIDDSLPFGTTHRSMVGIRPASTIRRLEGINPDGTLVFPGSGGLYDRWTDLQIIDRSIFDYRKHQLDGGLSTQWANFNDIIIAVEKTFFNDRVGIEFAYHDESFDEGQLNQLRGDPAGESIMLDFNRVLGTGDPTLGEPLIPNPNFGGLAVASRAENSASFRRRDSWRFTAFASLRADDIFPEDSMIAKVLGRLDATALHQRRHVSFYQIYSRDTPTISDYLDNLTVNGSSSEINLHFSRIGQYHALAMPGLPAGTNLTDFTSLADLVGADIQPINGSQVMPKSQNFRLWNIATNAFQDQVLGLNTILDGDGVPAAFFASKSREQIDSTVLNGLFYFMDDMIVFQAALRKDNQKSWNTSAPNLPEFTRRKDLLNPDFKIDASDAPGSTFASQITTWGIVVHTPKFLKEKLPWGLEVDFHYGEAQNFSPTSGRKNVLNGDIPAVSGSTVEKGFTVAFGQKLYAKVNWYETGIRNKSFDNGAFSAAEGIMLGLAREVFNPINVANGWTGADAEAALPSLAVQDLQGVMLDFVNGTGESNPNPSRQGSQDFVSKGVEVDIMFNPTRNWTMALSLARQETVTANTAKVLKQWFDDFVAPTWINSSFAQSYVIDLEGTETLADRAQANIGDVLTASLDQDGSPTVEQRQWRLSATTRYRFENLFQSTEWISNLAVGGSFRWQDRIGVGFPVMKNEFGTTVRDISNPFYGEKQGFLDLFVNWDTKIFGRTTTFQVYIRDLTNHDELIPVYANPDNSRTYRIIEGRMFSISATINF